MRESRLDPATWNRALVRSLFAAARGGHKKVARGKRLVVSTHHPLSAHAGRQVLRAGGTAADALVAITALDTVVLPGTSTLGGQLTVVLHEAGTGTTHALNAGFNAVLDDDAPYAVPFLVLRNGQPVFAACASGSGAVRIDAAPGERIGVAGPRLAGRAVAE